MKIYKSKIMKVINFIKNEGKFEFGDMVRVKELKKDLGEENFYAKYQGQLGIVTSISYNKKILYLVLNLKMETELILEVVN